MALGRPTRVTNTGSDGSTGSEKRTVYTGAGRTDRVSLPGLSTAADSALSWTRTIYDKAGRAIRTLAHYDITGNAGLAIDAFETPEADITINNDGATERWLGGAQTFTLGGSIAREAAASSTTSGGGRLAVTTGTGGNAGTEWALDGTFVGGHAYKARIWVNAPAGTSVTATFGVSGDSAPAPTPVAGNGAWQPLDVTWTPSVARTGTRLAVYRSTAASSVTFYLDDATAWDSASGATDVNIPTETAYDRDGHVVASIVAPGTVGTTELPMVTRTAVRRPRSDNERHRERDRRCRDWCQRRQPRQPSPTTTRSDARTPRPTRLER